MAANAELSSPEGGDNPQPAMQVGRGIAGDERPDITSERDPSAVAHQQTADDGGGQGAPR